MKNIAKALGDNAKFYPNYMTNHLASDFKFHLDNGIGRILENNSRLTEENAKLREALQSIQRLESRTPELPDNYSYEDVGRLNDRVDEIFGKVNTALNQLKEQNNDNS